MGDGSSAQNLWRFELLPQSLSLEGTETLPALGCSGKGTPPPAPRAAGLFREPELRPRSGRE